MMVLYSKLYQASDYSETSIKTYLSSLADEIVAEFPNSGQVEIKKELADFPLDMRRLQPIGILVNELLTNIMKYAFSTDTRGTITLSAELKGKHVTLKIGDNGRGIPESVGFENSGGFGLMLVRILAKQIKGTIRIERGKGTLFVLEFDT